MSAFDDSVAELEKLLPTNYPEGGSSREHDAIRYAIKFMKRTGRGLVNELRLALADVVQVANSFEWRGSFIHETTWARIGTETSRAGCRAAFDKAREMLKPELLERYELIDEVLDRSARAVLAELVAIAWGDEWNGAMVYASIHGYEGTPEGRARSQYVREKALAVLAGGQPPGYELVSKDGLEILTATRRLYLSRQVIRKHFEDAHRNPAEVDYEEHMAWNEKLRELVEAETAAEAELLRLEGTT